MSLIGSPMDQTRQYSPTLSGIRPDHVQRYLFASNMADPGSILDLACGCGYGAKILHDAGFDVTAGDICKDALEFGRLHYPGPDYKLMDAANPPSGRFDTLVTFETLEHLKNPVEFLSKVDCGMVIASVPNQERYPFDPEKFKDDDYPHLRHYTPREFESLLYESGYVVKEKWCQKDKVGIITPGTDGMFLIYIAE